MANLQNHKRVKIWKEDMISQQLFRPQKSLIRLQYLYFWETKFIADIIVGYLQLKLVCDESEMSPHALKIYARSLQFLLIKKNYMLWSVNFMMKSSICPKSVLSQLLRPAYIC